MGSEIDFSTKLKDIAYYNNNKRKFNKLYNSIWKKIAGPRYIGLCSYLFQAFLKEWQESNNNNPTVQDFADYYFNHTNPVESVEIARDDSLYYGRTINELKRLAIYYQSKCNDLSIPLEHYFDDIVNHAVVETFNGQMREVLLIQEYEKKGYKALHAYGKWDKDLGVDFIIKDKKGRICDYIQCKPVSTFANTNNQSLIEDRTNFFHKEIEKKKECERLGYPYYPTKFIMYNVEYPQKWATYKGKRGFLLEELIDSKGKNIIDISDFQYV